jgi:hypothetical protein
VVAKVAANDEQILAVAAIDTIMVDNLVRPGARTAVGCSEVEVAVESTCFSLTTRALRTEFYRRTEAGDALLGCCVGFDSIEFIEIC